MDILANGVIQRLDEFKELIDGEDAAHVRHEKEVLGDLSMKILPSLFKLVDSLHDHNTGPEAGDEMETGGSAPKRDTSSRVVAVTTAIASFSRLAPQSHTQMLFTKLIQKMLEASQSNDEKSVEKMCSLLVLAQALVISETLEESSIALLYRSLKPLIRTDETHPRVHKRAYKLLSEICKRYQSFIAQPERLKEMMDLLSTTSATSQVSARSMRLKCLCLVVEGLEESPEKARQVRNANQDSIVITYSFFLFLVSNISLLFLQEITTSSLVGETLLCLKDSNAKTREAAYKLLLAMAKIHGSPSDFIRVVAAACGSKSPHMRSAAVTALARLVYEFAANDMEIQNLLPSLLQTVLILSDDPSREVTKSMVIFVRISIQQTSVEQLEPLLPDIVSSLLKYHRGKDRFREKIKIIIKKLVKFFGYETLMPLVPPSDTRLLTHMRKLSEREARRKLSRRHQQQQQQVEHDPGYDAMVDSDGEEDSDDGRTLVTGMTRISRMSRVMSRSGKQTLKRGRSVAADETFAKSTRSARTQVSVRIKNDADGDVMDVKDLKTVRFAEANSDDDSDSDDDVHFDASGKLVVRETMDDTFASEKHHDEDTNMLSYKSKRSTAMMSQGGSTTRGKNNGDGRQQKKTTNNRIGSSYKAKKAGGDVKRKDQKYEPYAYVQLDGRNYSRKNRRHAVDQMGSVVQKGNKRRKKG